MNVYNTNYLPEKDDRYNFRVKFYKNNCSIRLDTTGDGLHKRGYRQISGLAPIEETLAASIIMLTPYKKGRILVDPFFLFFTFLIEAAMYVNNIPPGINRKFQSETWKNIFKDEWKTTRDNYKKNIEEDFQIKLFGYDIDKEIIKIAKENAKIAMVDKYIHFETKPVKDFISDKKYGFIITNPPYGERFNDIQSIETAYSDLKKVYDKLDNWSMYVITAYEKAYFGEKPKKDEDLYS